MNTVNFNEKSFVASSEALILKMKEDPAILMAATMDEAYEAFKKYAEITKEQFVKFLDFGGQIRNETERESQDGSFEMTDDELEIVVGGNFFGNAWNGIKSAAKKVSDFAKDTWNDMPDWAHKVIIGAGIGAAVGLAIFTCGATAFAVIPGAIEGWTFTAASMATAASGWAVFGAAIGGIAGGIYSLVKN